MHLLAPSGQGFPEGARAVDRRPFPRPVRGRGPQGRAARARPGPGARLRSGPASHRGCTATPQEARRITHGGRCTGRCAPSYLRRIWDRRIPGARVKKLAATDATAKNPMQATDATATPTDVLLGFVMRNPTCSHCSQNLQFGN